uniref:Uncharacterized protein n=1 Tax=Theileria annulata TaxID=5874 RepID=A0A3B0MV47_THEAN
MDFPSNSFSLSHRNFSDSNNSKEYFMRNQNFIRNNLSDSFLSRNQSPFSNLHKTFNTDPGDSLNFGRMGPPRTDGFRSMHGLIEMNNLMHDFLNKSLNMNGCLSMEEELSLIENINNQQKALMSVSENLSFLELLDETNTSFKENMKIYK